MFSSVEKGNFIILALFYEQYLNINIKVYWKTYIYCRYVGSPISHCEALVVIGVEANKFHLIRIDKVVALTAEVITCTYSATSNTDVCVGVKANAYILANSSNKCYFELLNHDIQHD